MDSLQNLKSRSKAVKNVGQITKAMEVVAATKMRRAQEVALNSRPYAYTALALLEKMTRDDASEHPLVTPREVKRTLLVIVASDKGLTGSFNAQVFRAVEAFLAGDTHGSNPQHTYSVCAVGKKAFQYAERKKLNIANTFIGFGDHAIPEEIDPLAHAVIGGYVGGTWDRVIAVSTHFRTALKQETLIRHILPVNLENIRETVREIIPEHGRFSDLAKNISAKNSEGTDEYTYEPSREDIGRAIIPHLVKMQMYHLILEANASEHSARRVAMKTASDNADDLLGVLTLSYNKVRQASITKEIIEITSTQNALS